MRFRPVELDNPAPTSTARRGIFSLATIGLQGGTRFASNWLIGLLAGKAVFGLVANATALAFLLNTAWPSSTQGAASKFIARARGKGDPDEVAAVARHVGVRVLQAIGVLAVAAPVVWHLMYGRPAWEGICVSAMVVAVAASQFARGVHFGAGQVARGTKVDLVTSVIGVGATGILLALGVRNILLTLPLTIAMTCYALLCWPWTARGKPAADLRAEIDKFVTFAALGSIASAGMLQLSQLIAGGLSTELAGEYAPALQLVTPLSIIAGALTLVLFPSMAEAQGAGDLDRLRRTTDLATRGFAAVLIPVFGALAIAARPVMELVWVGRYPESAHLMPAFCLALLVQNVAAPAVGSITSGPHRHMWYPLTLSWVGLAVAVAGWAVAVPQWGLLGVAGGYAAGALTTAFALLVVAWRINGQRWVDLVVYLALGAVSIAGLSWWRQTQPVNHVLDVAVAVGFALVAVVPGLPTLRSLAGRRRSA
ncbi:lipopolysaccharide biosynthesis protein [Propioniciclava tarda]|uniref:Lipopolysaccharide biosynthesis protein n=1 Tax=Propioniciclava tarda TaxID=433330 RepID=A0A4Q9KMQ8_PROTD|nr:lipid II flippase MurJ [Propioniciclava tarda]TBT95704.1 hypothetical protein ET996_04470 [Propioniciclava tarda]SMO45546.1 putative peptidoglycan lipid II flippase [Propioniciclava tarda]